MKGEIERLELNREVMLRLIKALIEGEELEEVAKIISMDPHLSVKLLNFINSPFFGLKREIKSIVQTVAYLGYKNLRDYIFVLLSSSFLRNRSREEIKNILKFAYLMRKLAERVAPEHAEEYFMVGILTPVMEEIGADIKEVLEKAGVSEYVINGLFDPKSQLGKLKFLAKELLDFCDKLKNGIMPSSFSDFRKEEVIETCVEVEKMAEEIVSTL